MPPIRSTNFINKAEEESRVDPLKIFSVTFLVVNIFFAGALHSLSFYFDKITENAKNKIAQEEAVIASLPLRDMIATSKTIKQIKDVKENSANTVMFLNILSDAIDEQSVLSNMTYVDKGENTKVTISGNTKNYAGLIKQIDRLKSEKYKNVFKEVELVSFVLDQRDGEASVSFLISIKLLPSVSDAMFETNNKEPMKKERVQIKRADSVAEDISTTTPNSNNINQ